MDSDIIILVIAIVFSIISGISNASKKKRNKTKNQPQPTDNPWEMTSDSYEGREPERETPTLEDFLGPILGKKKGSINSSEPSPVIDSAESDTFSSRYSEMIEKRRKQQDELNKSAKRNNVKRPDPATVVEATDVKPELSSSDILEGFELRKAVIYSEILKPKFKE